MLVQHRQLGSRLGQAAKVVSWIGVTVCRNCKPYSPPSSDIIDVANAPVEVFIPAQAGISQQTFQVKTDGGGWAKAELPVPPGTSVQVSVTDGGVTQRKIGITGADPGSGIVSFQFNQETSWTPWIIAGGVLALGGVLWWYFTREEEVEPALAPSLGEIIRKMTRQDLRHLRSKILKNVRSHCSEVYAAGSPEQEACRTAAAIAAAEVTDVFEEYGVDLSQ